MTSLSKGQIITFYSYKGGSSRSMTLANVAWILASNGKRVLVVDWDLEAPGLHRYFAPFLLDKELTSSRGVIDLVWEFVVEAMTPLEETEEEDTKWYEPLANILRYAVPVNWNFHKDGALDFVPAGRQGLSYAKRVNSFNWQRFYERFGGGVFLKAVKEKMQEEYDYILIDSRTGVSDTSGICTVQMPDVLAVFFTPNNQSIEGAASVAESVNKQWRANAEETIDKRVIFPIMARTDRTEMDKLDLARDYAKAKFTPFLHRMSEIEQEDYWGRVEIPYVPWYAFEEVLATFRDDPKQRETLLAASEQVVHYLTYGEVNELVPPSKRECEKVLAQFAMQSLIRTKEHLADFAIITGLEIEAQAVISRLENYSVKRFEDKDIRTYHYGTIPTQGTDHAYRIVVILLPSIGEISAATAVADTITRWNPRFVLTVGIAGGIPWRDLDLGDVVVADQIVGYEYDKVTDHGISPRDRVYPASTLLLDRVRNFWDDSWTQQISVPRPKNALRAISKLCIGPIASGNKAIALAEARQQLTTYWPKLAAVEMEGEWAFAPVFDLPQIPAMLVIRGICDVGDERSSGEWQEYAANAAAAFAVSFLKSGPVEPQVTTPEGYAQIGPEEVSLRLRKLPPRERKQDFFAAEVGGPEKISLANFPSTSPDLFGREKELAMLDAAWEDPQTNIVSLVAWGGVGKTALVNKLLLQMGKDHYRGAERVYGWSFYSQGAREGGQASADQFIAAALEWFGDPEMAKSGKSPWDKGERLAELVKQQRTILILDGLEPLQYPPGEMGGRLKDPGLQCLLRALARHNPGLCIITTRLPVDDLKEFVGTSVERFHLEHLSREAGAAYLAHLGVKGSPQELKQAVREFEGHALALTLLGSYLAVVYQGDIRQRDKIARLSKERRQGGHARRVMESYERWFQGKPELNILLIMGLFDRPAEGGAIEALRAEPAIPGLTSELQDLSHEDWQFAVDDLRAARLLAEADPQGPDTLDCHPLVREHFGGKLQESHPEAWREAHSRLYEYYKSQAPEYPDTLEEMASLYAAVAHSCQAGRHQEALDEVYWPRILRGNRYFSWSRLGAFGPDLASLSGFFDPPWRQPVARLSESSKGFVLNVAGFYLRALGRLAEAVQPMQVSLEKAIAQEDWVNAAIAAGSLYELYLASGDLAQALEYARQSVDLADRSGDAFQRMVNRTVLADALHQASHLPEAEAAFRETEEMQKEIQPEYPLLYSLQGYLCCNLLLGQEGYLEVQNRAGQTLEWAKREGFLLDIALDHLSLGQAYLVQTWQERSRDFAQATAHLDQAMDGLRQAGEQEFIALGLLARAELRRVMGSLDRARADLEEALSIATRGGMRLHEADCHLEYARLHLACGEEEKARQSLAQAKAMIEEMGYHRRDGEVAELEGELESLKH